MSVERKNGLLVIANDREVAAKDVVAALALRCSECYGALSFANAIGGSRSDAWDVVRALTASELIEEINSRGIDISDEEVAVGDGLIIESDAYKKWNAR